MYHARDPGHTPPMSSTSSSGELPVLVQRPPHPDTGAVLGGRYTLHEVRGTGGFATVFRAMDRVLDAPVAIKLANEVPSVQDYQRFDAEARLAARLQHPNIIRVLDYNEYRGRPYSVMPLLQGRVLRDRRGTHWFTISRLMQQLCGAIRALHEQVAFNDEGHRTRVLHRDIKPANCFVSERSGLEPHLTLLDLGLCKWMGDSVHTTRGHIVGSTAYMAPECIVGVEASVRSEVYSLGVTFYELLTGELPYGDEITTAVRMMQDPTARPPSPRDRQPDIPESLAMLVMRAMAPHMPQRYDSVAAMMTALDRVIGRVPTHRKAHQTVGVAPVIPLRPLEVVPDAAPAPAPVAVAVAVAEPPSPPRRSRRFVPVVALLVGLGAVGVTTVQLMRAASPQVGPELPPAEPQPDPEPAALVDDEPAPPPPSDLDEDWLPYGPEPLASPAQPAAGRVARPVDDSPPLLATPTAEEIAQGTIPNLRGCPNPPPVFFAQLHIERGHATVQLLDGNPVDNSLPWQACARRELESVQYPRAVGTTTLRLRLFLVP